MSKTLVIFDIDGTLLYSNKIDSQCFAQAYEHIYAHSFPTIDWSTFPHVSDTTIFETVIKNKFNRVPSSTEIDEFTNDYIALLEHKRKVSPDDFREVPGAKSMIAYLLSSDQHLVGIATGGWRRPAAIKLKHVGIDHTHIYDSYADGLYTREEILQVSIDKARAAHKIDHIVYIGDALWDVRTTRNMQLNFIGIRHKGDAHILKEAGADFIFENYSDQKAFLETLLVCQPPRNIEL